MMLTIFQLKSFEYSLQSMNTIVKIIALVLACLALASECAKPKQKGLVPGPAGDFKFSGLEEILSYNDFNRDGKIDILTKSATLNLSEQLINIYIWNQNRKDYQLWGSLATNYVELQTVLVSSFKDLESFHLVLFHTNPEFSYIKMIPFSCLNFVCEFQKAFQLPEIYNIDAVNPSLIGIMGNIGLLYHKAGIANVLVFNFNDTLTYDITPLGDFIDDGSSVTNAKYLYNGDYDGDCLTDLVILKPDPLNNLRSILQFIRGNETNQFKFIKEVIIPESVLHFTIQDINYDGKNDLILLLKSSKIQMHYHRHGSDKILCNGVALQEIPYDFEISEEEARFIQRFQFASIYPKSLLLFGDFNNDGYEDLSLTFADETKMIPQAVLLQNVGCLGASCGEYNPVLIQQSSTLNLRTFAVKAIPGISAVTSRLSFVDILEDGNLDFFFHMQVTDTSGIKYMTLQAVYNNVDYDAFFLTISILTSKYEQESLFNNTEYIGGVASFFVTMLSGELAPKTANQLAQAGSTLQLPYIRQGLGRTNNYLEDLTITVPRNPYSQFKWSPIIPNSDILIVPPVFSSATSEWTLQVLIEPTQKMGFVLLLVIVSLGILGAVILHLSRKQKEQDKQTQQSFYTFLR